MANTKAENANRGVNPVARIALTLISVYRYAISPMLPSRCRYYPTCSSYAEEAIRRYGILRGGWLALRRMGRGHPRVGHGVDLVPELETHPHSTHCCQRKP
ncbi:MAG: membrane protein insertion efficiency factor YidD [Pseudomonadota bacterium]|nr:membrane protein insertion efficiency factor YidD [Pseudomonadota bacterium]